MKRSRDNEIRLDTLMKIGFLVLAGIFASRIRESIAENSILGFIATQLEKETVCVLVWSKIVTHLTANDLRIGRVLGYWQAFFKLRCEDK